MYELQFISFRELLQHIKVVLELNVHETSVRQAASKKIEKKEHEKMKNSNQNIQCKSQRVVYLFLYESKYGLLCTKTTNK